VVRARIVADIVSAYERADEANGSGPGAVGRNTRAGGGRAPRPARAEKGKPPGGG
jgi:hypothetical protein